MDSYKDINTNVSKIKVNDFKGLKYKVIQKSEI